MHGSSEDALALQRLKIAAHALALSFNTGRVREKPQHGWGAGDGERHDVKVKSLSSVQHNSSSKEQRDVLSGEHSGGAGGAKDVFPRYKLLQPSLLQPFTTGVDKCF